MSPALNRQGKVIRLALPIMLGMLSQSLLNLVDAALVGHLGKTALAGVGIGGYAMFMMTALVFGLSSSVQSQTAQELGAGETGSQRSLRAGLVLGILVGAPLTLLAWWQAPWLMQLITPADDVQHVAVAYFRWRVLSLVAIALTLCMRGYWNGLQQTHLYLRIILTVHLANMVISAGLIYGIAGLPVLGTDGAAIGTLLSVLLGLALWLSATYIKRGTLQALLTPPKLSALRTTLRLATPHSLQQLCFAAGYVVLFWLLGQLGTESVAVGHVLINLSLLLILPGVGIGVATMSLVGEALGRDDSQAAHRWGLEALRLAGVLLTLLALPMLLMPTTLLGLFFDDGELVALGSLPLRLTGLMIILDAAALVLAQALMGAGAQRTVMFLTLGAQWLLFLPLAWFTGVYLSYGLLGVWLVQLLYRVINSAGFMCVWQRRRWAETVPSGS